MDPALIKIFAMNKPDCIKLMDVDMKILELALLDQVGVPLVDGMEFMREGLVGLPSVRPAHVMVPDAPQVLPVAPQLQPLAPAPWILPVAPQLQPLAPAGMPMLPVSPVYNIAAEVNNTINIINEQAPI